MSGPPEGWRTGNETHAFFAENGIEVHLSTITRQRDKYPELFQKHGRTVWIDAVRLLELYKSDYRGAIHAGEVSGARPSRLTAKPKVPAPVREAAAKADPPANDAAPDASESEPDSPKPMDPTKRKALIQAITAERAEAQAQGKLMPTDAAHAAATYAIAEAKAIHRAAMGPAAERIAALFRDDGRAHEVRAMLEDVFRSGWNTFGDALARKMTERHPDTLEDFRALEAYASELRHARDAASEDAASLIQAAAAG